MTGDINSIAAPLPTAPTRPTTSAADALKILTPLDNLLNIGDSAKAEVLTLKQTPQDFQLALRLTLASGLQTIVQASSSQPLPQGSQLTVTQLPAGSLAVLVQQVKSASVATLTQVDTQKLPIGTLLQGKVLSSQPLNQSGNLAPVYRTLVTLLNSALAGSTLSLDSPQPLRPGSLLTAQVQGSQNLAFVPLSGRLDQLAVSQQLNAQQSRQGSLDALLGALQNPDLPDSLKASADKLLAGLPDIRQMADPKAVAQALNASGLFLEARLLAGTAAQGPDLKSDLLRLIAQLPVPMNPAQAANTLAQVLPGYIRSALGTLGQVGEKPQASSFPLPSRLLQSLEGEDDLEHLLRLASAAISRLQSHQLSSLEQTGTTADGRMQTTWQLEIPMRNHQDIVPLQVKLQREDTRQQTPRERNEPHEPVEKLWRVELAFDLNPLGPLQVQAQLLRGSLSSELWAEQPSTASLIESQLGNLRQRLLASGLNVGELNCHLGTPPQGSRTHLEQRWVDETA
jgi:hypothetical protein